MSSNEQIEDKNKLTHAVAELGNYFAKMNEVRCELDQKEMERVIEADFISLEENILRLTVKNQ